MTGRAAEGVGPHVSVMGLARLARSGEGEMGQKG
jgi:hypothetical protein